MIKHEFKITLWSLIAIYVGLLIGVLELLYGSGEESACKWIYGAVAIGFILLFYKGVVLLIKTFKN